MQSAIDARKSDLEDAELDARLAEETVDVTLPVSYGGEGRLHPISQTLDEVVAIFGEMGFSVAEGPDIEDDFHNFEALNIPPPQRDLVYKLFAIVLHLGNLSFTTGEWPTAEGQSAQPGAVGKPPSQCTRK